jgi:hypothetical protein
MTPEDAAKASPGLLARANIATAKELITIGATLEHAADWLLRQVPEAFRDVQHASDVITGKVAPPAVPEDAPAPAADSQAAAPASSAAPAATDSGASQATT